MDLISIIVTTYKGLDNIFECVKSAMEQDYPNFEVIVVDDNGKDTDNQKMTEYILKPYFNYENFKYIVHKKNINGSAARNTGIKNSKGSYVSFLDDDDILYKNSIRLRYYELSRKPEQYGIVFSSFSQYIGEKKDFDCVYDFDGNILVDYLKQKIHSPSSVIMVKKEVIDNIGLWDETFQRHQDWEFVTRILTKYKACSVKNITVDRIVTWRNNAKSPDLYEKQRMYFLKKMQPYIKMLKITDQKQIYYNHYTDIGKNYLKNNDYIQALKWAKKSGYFFKALGRYFLSAVTFLKKLEVI